MLNINLGPILCILTAEQQKATQQLRRFTLSSTNPVVRIITLEALAFGGHMSAKCTGEGGGSMHDRAICGAFEVGCMNLLTTKVCIAIFVITLLPAGARVE